MRMRELIDLLLDYSGVALGVILVCVAVILFISLVDRHNKSVPPHDDGGDPGL